MIGLSNPSGDGGYAQIAKLNSMIYKKEASIEVKMRVYNSREQCPQAVVVYQETDKGHLEEFYHSKSFFTLLGTRI
jgi:hypothetical protein